MPIFTDMVIKLVSFGFRSPLFKQVMEVRRRVFVEEMGIDPDLDFDSLDAEAVHFLMLIDDQPAGSARWIETKQGIQIERLAIIPEHRHMGLGSLMLKFVVKDVLPAKKTIYLYSPENLQHFFMLNGFEAEGEKTEINGKPHYKMIYVKKQEERQGLLKKLFKK